MSYKILTVDDSRTIRMIVKKAFKPYDCTLVEAENGMEGLAAATKEKPDLIVLDITMPVMTGIEMLGKLLEQDYVRYHQSSARTEYPEDLSEDPVLVRREVDNTV